MMHRTGIGGGLAAWAPSDAMSRLGDHGGYCSGTCRRLCPPLTAEAPFPGDGPARPWCRKPSISLAAWFPARSVTMESWAV